MRTKKPSRPRSGGTRKPAQTKAQVAVLAKSAATPATLTTPASSNVEQIPDTDNQTSASTLKIGPSRNPGRKVLPADEIPSTPDLNANTPNDPQPNLASSTNPASGRATKWQMEAVRQVRMRMGQGYRRTRAQLEVASELHRDISELQAWERELVKSSDIENDLLCCELVGEFYDFLISGHYTNIPDYRSFGSYQNEPNIERAAKLIHKIRHLPLSEIRTQLRSSRRINTATRAHLGSR